MDGYGTSPGQLSALPVGSALANGKDTFWAAARDILWQIRAVLRPGGMACWVLKDYVKDGTRVRFSASWCRLCQACGFEPVLWVKALLVETTEEAGLFGTITKKRAKKSFFRRLHESKLPEDDERRIDHEDVLFLKRL